LQHQCEVSEILLDTWYELGQIKSLNLKLLNVSEGGFLHNCWVMEFYEQDIEYLLFVCFLSIQIFLELVPPPGLRFKNIRCLVQSVFRIVKCDKGEGQQGAILTYRTLPNITLDNL
jgi:hypothetical protein